MSAPDELPLGAPDTYALRRRVLAAGVVSLVLFLTTAYVITWLDVSDAWLLVAMIIEYLLIIRPLMRPVRDAVKLRRRLAYASWLEEKNAREQ